ncbi:hypothetical protein DFH28DRAFT_1133000 [Melampsora americana]|nr:hypothetical protein DFH28DRAFT_1133000 [Melampsora americana]
MGKGMKIECPLGGSAKKKRRTQPDPQGAAIVAGEVEASDAQYVNNRIKEIEKALLEAGQGNDMQVDGPPANAINDANHPNSNAQLKDNYINNFIAAPDPEVAPNVDINFSDYVQGSYYKRKQIVEKANWKKAIPKMFISYMKMAQTTSQWGNILNWNHDHTQKCFCGAGDLRKRNIDIVDILVRTQGFTLGLDEFLDPANPLMLVAKTNQPRKWRKTFASAIDAYRQMLRKVKELTICALELTTLDQLAMNCPRCFGPLQANEPEDESDYHVCTNGNFQHHRHLAASCEYEENEMETPPLFLDDKKVEEWKLRVSGKPSICDPVDSYTASHTAGADIQGKSTWKGCDETGLIGLACRHDHVLKFVNVVQSGERQYFVLALLDQLIQDTAEAGKPKKSHTVFYDIGCTLEKSVQKNEYFKEEYQRGDLKFATSAFHAYAHRWTCQLKYNPRLNKGHGLTDGEGNDRICHGNEIRCNNAARSTEVKLNTAQGKFKVALDTLQRLQSQDPTFTYGYFSRQWEQQKATQLAAMDDCGAQEKLEQHLIALLDLEEQVKDAHNELSRLRRKRRGTRTEEDMALFLTLPASIVELEMEVEEVRQELGTPEFTRL